MSTEAQARELWCPLVRIARIELDPTSETEQLVAGCNTDALGRTRVPASCRCIASECAMWRWVDTSRASKSVINLETSIDKIGLSTRSHRALRRAGANSVADAMRLDSTNELIKIDNLGVKSVREIRIAIYGSIETANTEEHKGYCGLAGRPEVSA